MGSGRAGGHQLFAHADGKRQIGEPIAVQMPELAAPDAKLDAAEPVRARLDSGP